MNPTISFGSQGNLPIYVNDKFLSLNPDSLFEDTIQYVTGDTLDVLADGLDTIYVLYSDTSLSANDSIEFRTANSDIDIGVTLGSVAKAIEHGQYGFGIEGFFTENHFSSNSTINTEGWQWLSDLYPQTIRFPGGANGKFMHLLPYRDMNYDEVLDPVSGYGYDIEEIIRFYDVTDDELMSEQTTNIDGAVYIVTPELIIEDLSDLDDIPPHTCNTCSDWMLSDYTPNLERFYELWLNDQSVAPGPNQMYIDQFISMINEMQDQNDYVIDVIIDLNIVTETAPQCKAIVEYLRDNNVNVAGVEMGNEANLRWAVDLMGFDSFNKYWLFINGYDPVTDFMDEFADYLWGYGSPALHDFIGQFKDDPDFICNVGIPADDVPNTETFISPFRLLPDSEHTPSWNEALYNHYDDNITVGGQTRYLFDAIIPHTYYHASGNWEDLLLDNIYPAYPENDGTFYSCTDPAADGWDFLNEDARLSLAYTKLLGSGVILPFGNYYEFIVTRHKEFYQVLSSYLHFNLTSAKKKDVWLTEWNIKTEPSAENPTLDEIQRLNVVDNAFPHSLVTQEWFLRNMKLNFVFPFREGFFTYATFHGFGGGSQTDPITPADCADCLQALPTPIDESLVNKYFMRRATYWNMLMLSEINRRQLKYLPSTFTKFVDNHNVTPTVFVDLDNEKLYVYFTNLKEGTQSYIINRNNLSTLFEGALDLELGYSWITALVFDRAYSTSGNNSIYRINDCYFCDDDPLTTNYLHPLEMQEINFDGANIPEVTAGLPYGAICVTVPSYSTGYFTIDLEISYRESEFNPLDNLVIYPNPASNEFRLFYSSGQQVEHESLNVTVYSLDGRKCITELSAENNALSIQNLPPGVYLVITQDNEQNKSTRKLVKID